MSEQRDFPFTYLIAIALVVGPMILACGFLSPVNQKDKSNVLEKTVEFEDYRFKDMVTTSEDTVLMVQPPAEQDTKPGIWRWTDEEGELEHVGLEDETGMGVGIDIGHVDGQKRLYVLSIQILTEEMTSALQVAYSDDEGETWTVGDSIEDFDPPDTDLQNKFAAGDDGALYTTTAASSDEGQSWEEHTLDDEFEFIAQLGAAGDQTVIAMASEDVDEEPGFEGRGLYWSDDGGQSWELSLKEDEGLISMHVFDEDTVWVTGGNGTIFGTDDGGQSWSEIFNIFDLEGVESDAADDYSGNAAYYGASGLDANGDGEVVVVTPDEILVTRDGGDQWSLVGELSPSVTGKIDDGGTIFLLEGDSPTGQDFYRIPPN